MRTTLYALVCGILFGAGLAVADMINPARVLGFLDLFGNWDPSLAFVMGAALLPATLAWRVSRRMVKPVAAAAFSAPANRRTDTPLLAGAALFGAGWGLVGFCPGPALSGLALGHWQNGVFVGAMLAGMVLHRVVMDRPVRKVPAPAA